MIAHMLMDKRNFSALSARDKQIALAAILWLSEAAEIGEPHIIARISPNRRG